MASKKELQQLENLEKKIQEMEAKKQQIEARVKEKERKERTRRLIQVGALIEKHFNIHGEDEALKLIYTYKKSLSEKRDKILNLNIEEVRLNLGEVKKETVKNESKILNHEPDK